MNQHPYLRAYLAGIAVPTGVMLVVFTVFCIARYVYQVPLPIERAIVFPLALIPNAFGAWNMLFLALRHHHYLPLGLHGAILPFFIVPAGYLIATSLGFLVTTEQGLVWFQTITIDYSRLAIMFPATLVIYYLVWKHLIGFLNEFLGIAG